MYLVLPKGCFFKYSCISSSLFSVAMIEHWPKATWGRRYLFHLPIHSPSIRTWCYGLKQKPEAGTSEVVVVPGSLFSSLTGSTSYISCIFQVHSSLNNTSSMLAKNILWNKALGMSSSSDPMLLSLCSSFLSYFAGLLILLSYIPTKFLSPLSFFLSTCPYSLPSWIPTLLHPLPYLYYTKYSATLRIYRHQQQQQQKTVAWKNCLIYKYFISEKSSNNVCKM